MTSKKRRNAIQCFVVNGQLIKGAANVRAAVLSHFSDHFQAHRMPRPSMDALQFRSLSCRQTTGLIKPFTLEEVKVVVWDCDNYKCPGPDGITFGFIKDFWHILKDDVMRFLVEFHRNGKSTKGINSTFIALIPKADNPQRLNDFCPISFVGSLYRILAKTLADRLHLVIGSVISETQSTFVKGR